MGQDGASWDPFNCGVDKEKAVLEANSPDLLKSYRNQTCNSGIAISNNLETWKPIHGQCVTYRQEQQSCAEDPMAFTDPAFNPTYKRRPDGKTFERPLVCDPKGGRNGTQLVCTGPDYYVLPNTCIQARPRDQCFSGPWWYSLECPRTAENAPKAGLSREQLMNSAATMMILFAGESAWPATCAFWDTSTPRGRATEETRKRMYAILGALWPADERIVGKAPTFEEVMAGVPNSAITANISDCYANENNADSAQVKEMTELNHMAMQPNKIWSGVHFLMHNQPFPMDPTRVAASKATAAFLLENFWCDDCRGFFYEGIVSVYGMPPDSIDPEAHAKWWWWGHNVASEHVAAIRGGHPWIHQLGAPDVKEFQNPFFMPWETAQDQWKVVLE